MSLTVAKAFNSNLRRYRENDPVDEADDFTPHNLPDLKKRKFVVTDNKNIDKPE